MEVRMSPGWQLGVLYAAADVIENVARAVGDDVRDNIRRGGHIDTGALYNSVHESGQALGVWRVSIGTDHWAFIEFGTEPHEIIAGPGEVLVFTKESGEVVFTKRVHHPGHDAYMVMRRALYKKRGLTRHG